MALNDVALCSRALIRIGASPITSFADGTAESEVANALFGPTRDALRRAIARQRAQFGASGIDMDSGSAQAVLLGIYDENDEKRAQREALDSLKSNILDNNYANQQRVNTLQLTQLKERNKLKKTGSVLESLTSIF